MLSPACMWSKARLTSSSPSVCVIISSTLMRPLMYQSTYCGNWVRPRVPPKAVPRHAELLRVRVDADDATGAGHDRALDHREADAAEPEDGDRRAGMDPGGVQHSADAGRDAAAEEAHLVERRVGADLRERDLGDDGPFGEGRGPHVMMQHAPTVREPARAVGHETLPLGGEQRAAQVRPARKAELALAALGDVERDHVVAGPKAHHTGPDLLDDAATLVAEHGGEEAARVATAHRVGVGVADAGRDQADQALAGPRALEIDLVDHERLLRLPADGGADLHGEARG